MKRILLAAAVGLSALAAGCATSTSGRTALPTVSEDPVVAALTADRLTTFDDEADFRAYLSDLNTAYETRQARQRSQSRDGEGATELTGVAPPLAPPPPAASPVDVLAGGAVNQAFAENAPVVVSGERSEDGAGEGSAEGSVTNVQTVGVDEGDIVKRVGDYLVVLQDGRLFSIALRDGEAAGLALAGRSDVYRAENEDTWYDEMLVFGDRVVVTGYSYRHAASEFSVFTLHDDGSFTRDGVFYISSNDYYDVDNYATRIIGDTLVLHTPIFLDRYSAERAVRWPSVRVWREEASGSGRMGDQQSFFGAADVYRPLIPTLDPVLHTVSFCSLTPVGDGDGPACRATAFVGPSLYEFYVSAVDAWIWTAPEDRETGPIVSSQTHCRGASATPQVRDGRPGAVYRIPLTGEPISVAATYGEPQDQFAFQAGENRFRALLSGPSDVCDKEAGPSLTLAQLPYRRFSNRLGTPRAFDYANLPPVTVEIFENRLTAEHVVYAGRDNRLGYPPEPDAPAQSARLVVAPFDQPRDAVTLEAPHDVIRMERLGDGVIVTGYRTAEGLSLSTVALSNPPRLTDTVMLQNRYETEGRSHAFNARVHRDGSALMGLPTTYQIAEAGRFWWRSQESDLSFLSASVDGELALLGELTGSGETHPSYSCEVSCIDWYGNSRPLFLDGRIFALSGTELIEGRLDGDRVREVARVDLTAPPPAQ